MFSFVSSNLFIFLSSQKIDAQAIEEFYGLTSDISKNSESGYILFYQSRDWASRSDRQNGRMRFVRDRIRQIEGLGFFDTARPSAPSPLSQVPFHPGLSVELCTGASVGPQTGAVDDRVTWTQHSNHQAEVIAVWFAVVSLACFVLLGTHKNAHINMWNELHVHLDGLRMDIVQTFFSPPHTLTSFIFDNLVHFSAHHIHHRWVMMCHDLFWHNITICPESRTTFFNLRCRTWHIMLHLCRPASYKRVLMLLE